MKQPARLLDHILEQTLGSDVPLAERQALTHLVRVNLQTMREDALAKQLVSAHRADPRVGIRGSELVVSFKNQTASAKMRLLLPDLFASIDQENLGFRSIRAVAAKVVHESSTLKISPRPMVPEISQRRLRAFYSQDH